MINCHVVVSAKTLDYFKYQVEHMLSMAKEPNNVYFHAYTLDPRAFDSIKHAPRLSSCHPVFVHNWAYRKKTLREIWLWSQWLFLNKSILSGSNGHAAGLEGFRRVHNALNGDHIIADVDTLIVQRDWDSIICELLERYDVIGAPYEPIGGFTTGNGKIQSYKNTPSAVWLGLSERVDWSTLSWWPNKEENLYISTQKNSDVYGLPIGYEVAKDVGWELCDFIDKHNLKKLCFDHVKPSSAKAKVLINSSDYSEEYQLDGEAFVVHQRGSSQNKFKISDLSKKFLTEVENQTAKPTPIAWGSSNHRDNFWRFKYLLKKMIHL